MSQNSNLQFTSAMAGVVGQVGCVVILLIGLALGGGMFLDNYLETGGIFTVLLLVGSVPVALYLTIQVSMRSAAKIQDVVEKQQAEKKLETESGVEIDENNSSQ
jgi:hypothetical protein